MEVRTFRHSLQIWSVPITDNCTRLLHLCMANNLVVTDTIFQHKPVHLQAWYNPNATDSTKHQSDHVLFRRCNIKAVQDTRVFGGADIESDHRLMVCKLRLKFRKPAKHTFHPRLQLAPLHSRQGSIPAVPARPVGHTSPHSYWGCGAQLGSPQKLPQHHGTGSAEATSKATATWTGLSVPGKMLQTPGALLFLRRLMAVTTSACVTSG